MPIIRIQNLTDPTAPANRFEGTIENRHAVKDGDLLVSWSATLDVFVWGRGEAVLNQHIFRVVPDSSQVSKTYLFYALKSVMDQLRSKTHGATMKHITKGPFEKTEIPVPPLEEQERIVKLLDEADELRKLRTQADRRTNALIPAFFHQMFGDPTANSKGWPRFRLDKVGRIQTGTTPATAKPEYYGGDIPFVRPAELEGFQPICKAEKYLTETGVEVGRSVRKGATLIGCIGQIGKTGIAGTRVAFNQQINAIEFNPNVHDDYGLVCCTLMSPVFQARAAQALLPILNKSRFSEIEIPIPPLALQNEFAQRVTETRELEARQATSHARLDALFQSMLHRAFNGEL